MSVDLKIFTDEMGDLGARITSECVAYAFMNHHNPNLILKITGIGMQNVSETVDFSEYYAGKISILRALSYEDLAEYIAECIMENAKGDKINIPSPFGGYWNMDLTSKEDIKKALLEEIELRGIANE